MMVCLLAMMIQPAAVSAAREKWLPVCRAVNKAETRACVVVTSVRQTYLLSAAQLGMPHTLAVAAIRLLQNSMMPC